MISSVFTGVYAAHEAENFSLGVASGVVTVNAEDATSVTTEIGGNASITSTGGAVNVLAYHNFDGTSFTGDDVEANSEALSIALLASLEIDESHMSAYAHSTVTAQVDGGGTIAAPSGAVVLKSMSSNTANSFMRSTGISILSVSVGSRPEGDRPGHDDGQLLRQRPRRRLDDRRAVADDPRGGRRLRGREHHPGRRRPAVDRRLERDLAGFAEHEREHRRQRLGHPHAEQHRRPGSRARRLRREHEQHDDRDRAPGRRLHRLGDAEPERLVHVNAGANITSQSGTITFDATHGKAPPAASDGTFDAATQVDPSNGSGETRSPSRPRTTSRRATSITYSPNGNPTIGGLTPGRSYSVVVTSSTQIQLGDSLERRLRRHDRRHPRLRHAEPQLPDGDSVIYFASGGTIGGLCDGCRYIVNVLDAHRIKLQTPGMSLPSVTCLDGSIDNGSDTINAANSFSNGDAVTYNAPTPDVVFGTTAADQDYDSVNHQFIDDNNDALFIGQNDGHGNIIDPGWGDGTPSTTPAATSAASATAASTSSSTSAATRSGSTRITATPPPAARTPTSSRSARTSRAVRCRRSSQQQRADRRAERRPDVLRRQRRRQLASSSPTRSGGSRRSTSTRVGRTGGPQNFAVEGVDFTSGGSGKLVFDITGTSSGTQQFLGIGGNVPAGAPAGDGIVTGTASGGGGGLIAVNNGNASSSETVTVSDRGSGQHDDHAAQRQHHGARLRATRAPRSW